MSRFKIWISYAMCKCVSVYVMKTARFWVSLVAFTKHLKGRKQTITTASTVKLSSLCDFIQSMKCLHVQMAKIEFKKKFTFYQILCMRRALSSAVSLFYFIFNLCFIYFFHYCFATLFVRVRFVSIFGNHLWCVVFFWTKVCITFRFNSNDKNKIRRIVPISYFIHIVIVKKPKWARLWICTVHDKENICIPFERKKCVYYLAFRHLNETSRMWQTHTHTSYKRFVKLS